MQEDLKQESPRLVESEPSVEEITLTEKAEARTTAVVVDDASKSQGTSDQQNNSQQLIKPDLPTESAEEGPQPSTAYFTRRLFAWVTDSLVVTGLVAIVIIILLLGCSMAGASNPGSALNSFSYLGKSDIIEVLIAVICLAAIYGLATVPCLYLIALALLRAEGPLAAKITVFALLGFLTLVQQAYFAGFTASRWQATPGKLLFDLKVTDQNGNKLSLPASIVREFVKSMSTGLLGIPLLLAVIFGKHKALHVLLSGSKIVSTKSTSKAHQFSPSQFAPYVAAFATLVFSYGIVQLCAPAADTVMEWPRLQLMKQIYGSASDAYCTALVDHINKLDLIHGITQFDPPPGAPSTNPQLKELLKQMKELEAHWGTKDARLMPAYLKVLKVLEYRKQQDKLEEYLKKYIECGRATNDPAYRYEGFVDYAGVARNAEGYLAHLYLTRTLYNTDLSGTYRTQEAYDLTKQALKEEYSYSEEFRVDLMRTYCQAAAKLGKTKEAIMGYDRLTELLCSNLNKLAAEYHEFKPSDHAGPNMTGEYTCRDLLALAQLQSNVGDLPGLHESLVALAKINELNAPGDATKILKLKAKHPQFSKLIDSISLIQYGHR